MFWMALAAGPWRVWLPGWETLRCAHHASLPYGAAPSPGAYETDSRHDHK